jgi:hypothetical protein
VHSLHLRPVQPDRHLPSRMRGDLRRPHRCNQSLRPATGRLVRRLRRQLPSRVRLLVPKRLQQRLDLLLREPDRTGDPQSDQVAQVELLHPGAQSVASPERVPHF